MGDLIHDPKQRPLPWQSHKAVCRRCKGQKTIYYAAMRGGVEVVGALPAPSAAARAACRNQIRLPNHLACRLSAEVAFDG